MEGDERREALRAAGQAYFDKVLEEAVASGSKPGGAPPAGAEEDPELAAVGTAIESSKIYIATGVYVLAGSASLSLSSASVHILPAPTLVLAMHLLSVGLACLLLSHLKLLPPLLLSPEAVRQSIIPSLFHALTALGGFKVLHVAGVELQLVSNTAGGALAASAMVYVAMGKVPRKWHSLCLGSIVITVALYVLLDWAAFGSSPSLSFLWVIVAWKAAFAERLWAGIRKGECRKLLERQDELLRTIDGPMRIETNAGTRLFLSSLLPLIPVIIVGVVWHEDEIAEHEVSVPSVSTLLTSSACTAVTAMAALLFREVVEPATFVAATFGTQIGTWALNALVFRGQSSVLGSICVIICVVAGAYCQQVDGRGANVAATATGV